MIHPSPVFMPTSCRPITTRVSCPITQISQLVNLGYFVIVCGPEMSLPCVSVGYSLLESVDSILVRPSADCKSIDFHFQPCIAVSFQESTNANPGEDFR
jgi:hypothetical protein